MENHPTWKFPIFGENPKDCVLIKGLYFHVSGFQLFRKDNPFIKMMDKPVPGIYIYITFTKHIKANVGKYTLHGLWVMSNPFQLFK